MANVKRPKILMALASMLAAVTLGAAACNSVPAGSHQQNKKSAHLTKATLPGLVLPAADRPPACQPQWLTVSMYAAQHGTRKAGLRFHDVITVRTTNTCELQGWPSLEQAVGVKGPTGATPRYITVTTGRPERVTLSPGLPAVSHVVVTVPKSWIWGGGNLCASFPSALVRLDGLSKAFFIEKVPTTTVSCGGSAPFHVTAGPFASLGLKNLVAVPYGDVQLSVPGKWWVEIPGSGGGCESPPPPGELVLGGAKPTTTCGGTTGPANTAYLFHIKQIPPKYAGKPVIHVHGVPVIVGAVGAESVTLYVPGYLEEVVTKGPLAPEIAGTLRFAPRLTALGKGPIDKPTTAWHLVNWRGLAAWVPKSWKISYTDISNTPVCSTDVPSLPSNQVLFDSDQKDVYPPCPFQQPTAQDLFGYGGNGLRMDLHPWKAYSGRGQLSKLVSDRQPVHGLPVRSSTDGRTRVAGDRR